MNNYTILLIQNTQQNFLFDGKYTINEIVKAGSMGHGTAVFGDFDVDLVIYSDGNSTIPITTIIIMQVVCYNNCQKV